MEWIQQASEQLSALLNPAGASRKVEIAELRQAGVLSHTIESLYPTQAFPHAPIVKSLIQEPAFATHARKLVTEIDLLNWLKLTPSSLGEPLIERLRVSHTSQGTVNFYDRTDPVNWHLLMQLNSQDDPTLSSLTRMMLLLPIALEALSTSPSDEAMWLEHKQRQFIEQGSRIRKPVKNLIALVRAQVP